jgi:hypothetical protein
MKYSEKFRISGVFARVTWLHLFALIALLNCGSSGDGSGGGSGGSTGTTTTATDTTAPIVGTAISFSGVSATGLSVNWGAATDETTAASSLQYKVVKDNTATANIDTIAEADAKSGADLIQDYTANITSKSVTGLTASTTYHFAVVVRDAAGNKAIYTPGSQATSATADVTPPTVGTAISFASVTSSTLSINWGAATDGVTAQTSLEYRVVKDNTATANIDTVAEVDAKSGADLLQDYTANITTKAITGLASSTTYHFAVVVRDGAGNKAIYTPASQATAADPAVGTVVINEITWSTYSGAGTSDPSDDMLELRNTTGSPINISGWVIVNAGTSGSPNLTIPASTTIPANGYYVIASKVSGMTSSADWVTSTLDLASGGELLTLQNASSNTIDSANQAGAWFKGLDDTTNKRRKSMERNSTPGTGTNASDWHTTAGCGSGNYNAAYSGWTMSTPGAANSAGTEGDCGRIQLNKGTYYTVSALATLTLIDADLNTNAGAAETANVTVKSATTDTTGETITLTETGVNTGIFTNTTLGFELAVAAANGKVAVADNETITASYADALPSGTRTGTATWKQNVTQKIIINELSWMGSCGGAGTGTTADTTDEWVELYNNTTSTIDFSVTPYSFYSNGTLQATINSGTIASNGFFVLARKASGASALTDTTGADFWSSGISLNNSTVQWIIYDGTTSTGDASDIAEDGVGTPPGSNGNCNPATKASMSRNDPGGAVPKTFADGTASANWHAATTVKGGRFKQTSPDYNANLGTPGAAND